MRCSAAQRRLIPLLLGELDDADATRVLEHVRACHRCQHEMDALSLTMDLVRELPEEPFPAEIDAEVAKRVARAQAAPARRAWSWQARAAAVVVPAVLALGWFIFHSTATKAPPGPATVAFAYGEPVIWQGQRKLETGRGTRLAPGVRVLTEETDRILIKLADGSQALVDFDSCVEVSPQRKHSTRSTSPDLVIRSGRTWVWNPGDSEGMRVGVRDCSVSLRAAEAMLAAATSNASGAVTLVTLRGHSVVKRRGEERAVPEKWIFSAGPDGRSETIPVPEPRLRTLHVQGRLGSHYEVWKPPALSRTDLLETLVTPRIRLGLRVEPIPTPDGGLRVESVAPGSPAASAGVRAGDIVLSLQGRSVDSIEKLFAQEILLGARDRSEENEQLSIVVVRRDALLRRRVALSATSIATECSPRSLARIAQAGAMVAAGDLVTAQETYRAVLQDERACMAARFNLGLLEEYEQHWREAAACYRDAVAVAPDNADIRLAYGRSLMGVGNLRRATEELSHALSIQPDLVQARYLLSLSLLLDGREAECLRQAQKLRTKPGTLDLAELILGQADYLRGETETARMHYERALARNPFNLQARVRLGAAEFAAGHPKEAERLFRQAFEQDHRCFKAVSGLGIVYGQRKEWRRAEDWLRRALALRPESAEVLNNLGWLNSRMGRLLASEHHYQQAEHHYRQALTLDPAAPFARIGLGMALERQGQYAEAAEQYVAALELDPSNRQARDHLVDTCRWQNQLAEAERILVHYWL